MNRLQFLLVVGLGISACSFGQSKLNFQSIDLPQDSIVYSVNNSGTIACNTSQKLQLWTPQKGLTPVTIQPYDKFRTVVSDTGKVYGESNGSIVQFDVTNGHKTLIGRSAYTYSIIDVNQDNLLIKSRRGSQIRYFTLKSGVTSGTLPVPAGFNPMSIGGDGVIRGLENGGMDVYGFQTQVLAKLNTDGSLTADAHAVPQVGGYVGWDTYSTTQTIKSLSDGTVISVQFIYNGAYHSSTATRQTDVYFPNGTHVVVTATDSEPSHLTQGIHIMMPLKDGRVLGNVYSSPFDTLINDASSADHLCTSGNANSVSIADPSVLSSGSVTPNQVVAGTFEGVLIGSNLVGGHYVFSLSVPTNSPISHYLKSRA